MWLGRHGIQGKERCAEGYFPLCIMVFEAWGGGRKIHVDNLALR